MFIAYKVIPKSAAKTRVRLIIIFFYWEWGKGDFLILLTKYFSAFCFRSLSFAECVHVLLCLFHPFSWLRLVCFYRFICRLLFWQDISFSDVFGLRNSFSFWLHNCYFSFLFFLFLFFFGIGINLTLRIAVCLAVLLCVSWIDLFYMPLICLIWVFWFVAFLHLIAFVSGNCGNAQQRMSEC